MLNFRILDQGPEALEVDSVDPVECGLAARGDRGSALPSIGECSAAGLFVPTETAEQHVDGVGAAALGEWCDAFPQSGYQSLFGRLGVEVQRDEVAAGCQ